MKFDNLQLNEMYKEVSKNEQPIDGYLNLYSHFTDEDLSESQRLNAIELLTVWLLFLFISFYLFLFLFLFLFILFYFISLL